MEYNWERTLPFLNISKSKVNKLFKNVLEENDIENIIPINEGCRTTNYLIETKNSSNKYILKIFSSVNQIYIKEINLFKMLENSVPIQKIYKISNDLIIDKREYAIYNYIDGETLGHALKNKYIINKNFIKEVAQALANIHSYKFDKTGFLDKELKIEKELPSLTLWYEMFINQNTEKRLGKDILDKIRLIVQKNKDELEKLDNDPRLVHGDFQGTNLLISNGHLNGILDWEFVMSGHPISDIGQFFRYEEYFNDYLIDVFELEYNKHSSYKLTGEWYKISKLRDLVSLIQLISGEEDMPNKYKNIKEIIINNLKQF